MNRREAISSLGILLGGTLSASTFSALLSGCSTPNANQFKLEFLSQAQFNLIEKLAEAIIPETDTPGASGAGVHRFIDNLLANYYSASESRHFASLLDRFSESYDAENRSFEELSVILQNEDAKAFSTSSLPDLPSSEFYIQLKELVVSGYYTSEIGMTQELRLNPMGPGRLDIDRRDVERTWSN